MKNIIYTNSMNNSDLKNLTKSQLINLLLKQNAEIQKLLQANQQQQQQQQQQPKNDDNVQPRRPIPTSRKSVKQMVQEYEDHIILPPLEFRDGYKPVPLPRTKIEQVAKALKGYTKSFEIGIKNNKDPLEQLKNTRNAIEHHIISILTSKKGLKFV